MIIIAEKPGQLGNMLFLYSQFIARSIESRIDVACPAFEDYAKYFPAMQGDVFCRFPVRTSMFGGSPLLRRLAYRTSNLAVRLLGTLGGRIGPVRAITLYDWTTVFALDSPEFLDSLGPRQVVLVRGWLFRDEAMFRKHAAQIRSVFRPSEEHCANVAALIERARADADVLVGVHIRHGIINFANARHYWNPPEKYVDWMGKIEALFPGRRVGFLICSDVQQDPAVFASFRTTFGTGHLVEDLYSFAGCDYLFGPPSTYTMWASFYGEVPLRLVTSTDWEPRLDDFTLESAGLATAAASR